MYLREKALCEKLSITRTTLLKWRKSGMPFIKIERLVLFKTDEVEKWMEQFKNKRAKIN